MSASLQPGRGTGWPLSGELVEGDVTCVPVTQESETGCAETKAGAPVLGLLGMGREAAIHRCLGKECEEASSVGAPALPVLPDWTTRGQHRAALPPPGIPAECPAPKWSGASAAPGLETHSTEEMQKAPVACTSAVQQRAMSRGAAREWRRLGGDPRFSRTHPPGTGIITSEIKLMSLPPHAQAINILAAAARGGNSGLALERGRLWERVGVLGMFLL